MSWWSKQRKRIKERVRKFIYRKKKKAERWIRKEYYKIDKARLISWALEALRIGIPMLVEYKFEGKSGKEKMEARFYLPDYDALVEHQGGVFFSPIPVLHKGCL